MGMCEKWETITSGVIPAPKDFDLRIIGIWFP